MSNSIFQKISIIPQNSAREIRHIQRTFFNLIKKRELCILLNPEDCYRMFSEIISNEKDSEFAISIVDILNTILLTSTELFDLRTSLKNFDTKV